MPARRVPIIDRLFLLRARQLADRDRTCYLCLLRERERVQQRSAKVVRAVIRDLFLGHCFDSGFLLLATGLILISSLYPRYFYVGFVWYRSSLVIFVLEMQSSPLPAWMEGTKYTRRGRGKHTRANEKIKCAIIEAQFLFAPLSSTERRNTIAKYKQTRTVYTPRLIKFPFRLRVFSLASRFFLYFSLISLGPLFFKKGIISNGGVMAASILGIVDSIQGVASLSSDSFRTDGKKNSIFE